MRFKKFIFKYAGLPGEPSGFEGPMLYLAAILSLTAASVYTVIADPSLGFSNPLLPVTAFVILKFLIAAKGDWIIYGPVKVGISVIIYFIGMSAISNGWWYLWAVIALLFFISGIIDLIACVYDWFDRARNSRDDESESEGLAL